MASHTPCPGDRALRTPPRLTLGGALEIVIDRFDAKPAQRRQTIAHRILQGAALWIVENMMGGGLPDNAYVLRGFH